jgi:hypothetical protein
MAALHEQLRTAADLISQPLLLEVLVGTESGSTPRDAAPADADPELLLAAVRRLTEIGAVQPNSSEASPDQPLVLTSRGEELLRLLRELEAEDSV